MLDLDVICLNVLGMLCIFLFEFIVDGNICDGLFVGLLNGLEINLFVIEDVWGYCLFVVVDWNDVMVGINLCVRVMFFYDVDGIILDLLYFFIEDVKLVVVFLIFDYLSKWLVIVFYSVFWGGIGIMNVFLDRDFILFNIKYVI